MRLIAAVNAGLDASLPVRAVFEAPTVARLAPRIGGDEGRPEPLAAGRAARGDSVVLCPEPVVVHRPVPGPLTDLQHGSGVAAAWTPRCRRAGRGTSRCGGPSGDPAHPFCRARGDTAAAGRARRKGRLRLAGRRCHRLAAKAARQRPHPQRGESPVRSGRAADIPATRAGLSGVADEAPCWWPWCTISPPTACRSRRCLRYPGVAYASRCAGRAPESAPLAVQYVHYRQCSLGISATATAASPRSWPTGRARWPECRSTCSCPRIGPTRRCRLPRRRQRGGGLAGRAAAAGCSGGPRAECDQLHGGPGCPGGAAGQAEREF